MVFYKWWVTCNGGVYTLRGPCRTCFYMCHGPLFLSFAFLSLHYLEYSFEVSTPNVHSQRDAAGEDGNCHLDWQILLLVEDISAVT